MAPGIRNPRRAENLLLTQALAPPRWGLVTLLVKWPDIKAYGRMLEIGDPLRAVDDRIF
jgi:hypothetical protein